MIQNVYGVFKKNKSRKNGPIIIKRGDAEIIIPQSMMNNNGTLKRSALKMIQESKEEETA